MSEAIQIPTDELRHAAVSVAAVASSHTPFVEIRTDKALTFRVVGINEEITATVVYDIEFPAVAVDARALAAVARKAPAESTWLELLDHKLEIRSGSLTAHLPISGGAFPPVTKPQGGVELDLAPLVAAGNFTSPDSERPVLTAASIGPDRIIGTDGYKAIDIPAMTGVEEDILIPRTAIKLAAGLGMQLVRLSVVGTRIVIADDEAQIVSRSIDGRIPSMFWPDPVERPLKVDATALAGALDRLSALSNDLGQVDLTCEGEALLFRVENGTDEIPAEGVIAESIRFDSSYLSTIAASFTGPMEMHIKGPLRPVLCTGEEDHRCLVIPQRVI